MVRNINTIIIYKTCSEKKLIHFNQSNFKKNERSKFRQYFKKNTENNKQKK